MHECIDVPVCCGPHKVYSLRCQRRLCSRAVLHGVEKRATVVAVDVYGCFKSLIIYCCSTGRTSTQRSSVGAWGKREWKDVESSRVVDGIGMSCHLSAEMDYSSVLHPVRPVSCVQRPDPPSSKMMQRNANSDFGVNCAQPECVQCVQWQSGAIMMYIPSLPPDE